MDDKDRAIEIEFGILAVFVAGAFVAGLIAAIRFLAG
jgi:Flp pilus assembly pilin Flp